MGRKPEIDKPQQQAFSRAMAATGSATYAAEKAGYRHPHRAGAELMTRPTVIADVKAKQMRRLVDEALPLALDRLMEILRRDNVSDPNRLKAIQITMNQVNTAAQPSEVGDLSTKTTAEWAQLVRLAEARLAIAAGIEDAHLVDDEGNTIAEGTSEGVDEASSLDLEDAPKGGFLD